MAKTDQLFKRAVALLKAGRYADSRLLMEAVIREDPENQLFRAWYVQTFQNIDERIHALREFLKKYPWEESAKRELEALLDQQYFHHLKTVKSLRQKLDTSLLARRKNITKLLDSDSHPCCGFSSHKCQ